MNAITIFRDVGAQEAREIPLSSFLEALRDPPRRASKQACELFVGARFGTARSARNALRHDDNVTEITAVTGDYDGEQVTLEAARDRLEALDVEATLYTSPSHTPGKPRWRVIAPLSSALPPTNHPHLADRLNAALGGILARESRTLSQSFYFGRVNGHEYACSQATGRHIDLAGDLDDLIPELTTATGSPVGNGETDVALREHIVRGDKGQVYTALRSLSARLIGRGMAVADAVATLHGLLNDAAWKDRDPVTWNERCGDVQALVQSAAVKFADQRERMQSTEAPRLIKFAGKTAVNDRPPLYQNVEQMLVDAVYAASTQAVALRTKPHLAYLRPAFDSLTAASMQEVGEGKDKKMVKVSSLWMTNKDRVTVDTVTFSPGDDRFCNDPVDPRKRAFNLWTPFDRSDAPGDWEQMAEVFVKHVYYLIPEPVDASRFLDWLSHIEQFPGQLPHAHWLLIAVKQGIGRNWLADLLARVWAGAVASGGDLDATIGAGFNGVLGRKLLVVLDEVHVGDGSQWKNAERLKAELTASVRIINEKYGPQYAEKNTLRWLMFSNHRDALPIPPEDRRINVSANHCLPQDAEYYRRLYGMLKDAQFVAAVARYLKERNIADFNHGAPALMSQSKRNLIANTKSEMTLKVEAIIAERMPTPDDNLPQNSDLIAVADIWHEIDPELRPEFKQQHGVQLGKALLAAGAVRHPARPRLEGIGKQAVWIARCADYWCAVDSFGIAQAAQSYRSGRV